MWNHISTYVMLGSVLCALGRLATAWSMLLPLHLLCTAVVFCSHGCTDPNKYAVAAVKMALLLWATTSTWRCLRVGPAWTAPAVAVAAAYVTLGDIRAIYGCEPSCAEYAGTVALAALAYGALWQCKTMPS